MSNRSQVAHVNTKIPKALQPLMLSLHSEAAPDKLLQDLPSMIRVRHVVLYAGHNCSTLVACVCTAWHTAAKDIWRSLPGCTCETTNGTNHMEFTVEYTF